MEAVTDGVTFAIHIPVGTLERIGRIPGGESLLQLIEYGITAVVLAAPEEEGLVMGKQRYRVEPIKRPGRYQWRVRDDKTGRAVWPGGALSEAHNVADRLNREPAPTTDRPHHKR